MNLSLAWTIDILKQDHYPHTSIHCLSKLKFNQTSRTLLLSKSNQIPSFKSQKCLSSFQRLILYCISQLSIIIMKYLQQFTCNDTRFLFAHCYGSSRLRPMAGVVCVSGKESIIYIMAGSHALGNKDRVLHFPSRT